MTGLAKVLKAIKKVIRHSLPVQQGLSGDGLRLVCLALFFSNYGSQRLYPLLKRVGKVDEGR